MGLIDNVKSVAALVKRVADAELRIEFQDKIIELQDAVMSVQQENATLQQEVTSLKGQLQGKQDKQELKTQFERKGNAYWKDNQPYCVACVESGDPRTLVQKDIFHTTGECPHCKAAYEEIFERQPMPMPLFVGRRSRWEGIEGL